MDIVISSALFLYLKGMTMQSMGMNWGKQWKSLAHGNLGAVALGRTALEAPDGAVLRERKC